MTTDSVRTTIREYILKNFVFEENAPLGDDQSLLRTGVVDSTGILELIAFTQQEFKIDFDDSELVADNFDTINRVAACVAKKLQARSSSTMAQS